MTLLETWRNVAYESQTDQVSAQSFWNQYFEEEKKVYEKLLANPDEVVKGTVADLAKQYDLEVLTFVGFLDGINDSLVTPNPIEEMKEDTEVTIDFDNEKLFRNMVDAKAEWLYTLPQWDNELPMAVQFRNALELFTAGLLQTDIQPDKVTSNFKK